MKSFRYNTNHVCSKQLSFDLDEMGHLHNVRFYGGCPGNLSAISKLVEGQPATQVAKTLKGNDCGGKGTSCADQLAQAIEHALNHI